MNVISFGFGKSVDSGGYLGWIFFGADIVNRNVGFDGQLGEKSRLADAWLAGKKVNSAFGNSCAKNSVEFGDVARKSMRSLGGESGTNCKTFGWLDGDGTTRL